MKKTLCLLFLALCMLLTACGEAASIGIIGGTDSLVRLGYKDVKEFGGIMDRSYEAEK